LARTPGLVVAARNTAFTYKGQGVDAKELGCKLGLRYMLEGSARRNDKTLRVTAQLIETQSGTHVWAERFDRHVEDLFKVRDQPVDRIVGSVTSRLRQDDPSAASGYSPCSTQSDVSVLGHT
jgi:TolB-like protein